MKLTKKQQLEKENLEWFGSLLNRLKMPNDEDFIEYLAHSERGIPIKPFVRNLMTCGEWLDEHNEEHEDCKMEKSIKVREGKFNYYILAKSWRGRMVHEVWEESFYSESGGWWAGIHGLLTEGDEKTPVPGRVKEFVKKEIFGGQDADLFDKIYSEICQNYLGINGGVDGQTSSPNSLMLKTQ